MSPRGSSERNSSLQVALLALLLTFTAGTAWAQDATDEDEDDATTETEDAADLDRVVVTGSRLQRETYTSISPLQIITATESREAGLIDSAEILQKSTASAGQQIDLSFTGFVLDNGPGASTVDLRGLGAARTLVLLNGRRLAPSGVEGAPASPDLNLVPAGLVQRYEVLLDGASSVYGSDAVAGVTNIILRKDFDGFEFDVFYNHPEYDNGESYNVTGSWGMNFDRGMIGFGLEYNKSDSIRLRDRPWTDGCAQHHEITTNGEIRFKDLYWQQFGMDMGDCALGSLAGRTQVATRLGSIYYTPGYSNGAFPNFSEAITYGFGVDGNGDGMTDVNYIDYDITKSEAALSSDFFPGQERLSAMGYGEYTFEGDMNNTAYFEFNFTDRDVSADGGAPQLFPYVPANNPYNLCNPDAEGGVDCGLATDALYNNPNYITQFADYWTAEAGCFGLAYEDCVPAAFGLLYGPIGATRTRPIVSVIGDRAIYEVNNKQYRGVIGMNGDLPFVDWGSMSSWVYDLSLSYTTSDSTSSRPGIRGDRLDLALGWYSSTATPCENDLGFSTAPRHFGRGIYSDTAAGCVPVNLYASSLYPEGAQGDFATAAERDYLFDTRDFDTEYTQTIFSAYANGFLFELPGGTALGGIGIEWREDDIKSIPDEVAREGLFWGFFSDGGATGSKWTREIFGEIELPVLAGVKGAEELIFNFSGRYTDDEFYGDDFTYTAKIGYRPINSLLLRGTFGTSFRAPSVREVFLLDQTGFLTLFDPCAVPESALGDINAGGGYDPSLDTRDPVVLENCRLQGVDPTTLIDNGNQFFSTEIARGGTTDLEAETSESLTYGFAFEQPWFESFDLVFGMTWYDIEVKNTIIDPSAQFLINDCYNDSQFDSTFCENIIRDQDNFLDIVNAYFINRDSDRARGMDINANYDQNFNIGSRAVRFGFDLAVNRNDEASTTFVDDDGNADFEDFTRSTYYPKWRGQLGLRTQVEDFRFTWVVNYTGKAPQYAPDVDEFDDLDGSVAGFFADTCLGPPDDVYCRDYADIDDYWLHSASVYWYGDTWTIGAGIRNVFDEAPPRVDGNEVLAINNVPIGASYDLFGRVYFFNLSWRP
ncbi:MAG: TonB-dependent receptor [Gammaproteobacteria bacterium]|nr:TonB-dependent receptor [Gammaproteobacteria bacterium]MBT8056763.1 TonB-dependent receptor [Gammaproteobacteria bacterium]